MTVGTLAERLVVAPHTATELTGRLVAAGLVARVVDLADRRRHIGVDHRGRTYSRASQLRPPC